MAYMFKCRPRPCGYADCNRRAIWDVRGGVPARVFPPQCKRHAQMAYILAVREEQGRASIREPATARPAAGEGTDDT